MSLVCIIKKFKMKKLFILLIASVTVCFSITAQDAGYIKIMLDSIAGAHNIPSIGFAVVNSDSVIVADAVGVVDLESGLPAGPVTVYRIGSSTKSFIAMGIMRLVQEGRISPDDRLSDLMPHLEMHNRWEETHPVLLKHLLEHTAGFRDLTLADLYDKKGSVPASLEEVIRRRPGYFRTQWKPGTRHAYSNPGYSLLGYIIESYSGKSYAAYLEELILGPLEMRNSDFYGRDHGNLALSYNKDMQAETPYLIFDHPAGYLHSTPGDMAKFLQFMLGRTDRPNSGFLLEPELLGLMERPNSIVGAESGMIGYGSGLYATAARGNTGYGHGGGINEYLTDFVYFPEAGIAWYYTMTRMDGEANEAVNDFLKGYLLPERETLNEPVDADYGLIEGWYGKAAYRMEFTRIIMDVLEHIRLEQEGDTLFLITLTGERQAVFPLGDGLFRTAGTDMPTHFIGKYERKTVISSSHGMFGSYFEKTTAFSALWRFVLMVVSINMFILLGLSFTINYLAGRLRKQKNNLKPAGWMALGLLSLILMIVSFSQMQSVTLLSTINPFSVLVMVFSALFGLSLIGGLFSFRKGATHRAKWKRILVYGGYGAWSVIVLFLAFYKLMPVITWLW